MLRVEGLGKTYGERVALAGVSFALAPGTITAVIGGNGAGKSTLLRCIAGLAEHDGRVELERPVAYLPQSARLPAAASTAEIVELFSRISGRAAADVDPAWLGAGAERRAATLSGGEQQRAALAALFALDPRTLLLDEPTANLDDAGRAALAERLRGLAATGATIVVTSPAPQASALLGIADRVITLERGRLVDPA